MYLVCFFGVVGRGIQYTRRSHVHHILNVLEKRGIEYKVLVVNNNIGDALIDGETIDNDDTKFIPSDIRVELNQRDIDAEIMKTYPKYWEVFSGEHSYADKKYCLNALRQSYIEHRASMHISESYERVIAISADFQVIHDIPIQDIIMKNEIILSDMNHAHGYTNGLYIGTGSSVKKTMDHFYNLSGFVFRDYEQIIKRNVENNGLNAVSKHIIFAKIRANRSVFILRNNRLKQKIIEALDRDYPRKLSS